MSPKPDRPINPWGVYYEHGTPEEEEAKHAENVARARERKKLKDEKQSGVNKNDAR